MEQWELSSSSSSGSSSDSLEFVAVPEPPAQVVWCRGRPRTYPVGTARHERRLLACGRQPRRDADEVADESAAVPFNASNFIRAVGTRDVLFLGRLLEEPKSSYK